MNVIRLNNNNYKEIFKYNSKNTIITIGAFDGIHLAHKAIIDRMKEYKNINSDTQIAIMTFDPHPDYILKKRDVSGYITPTTIKALMFEKMGIDYLYLIDFNEIIANMNYLDFYDKFLSPFKFFVIGYDFKFGKNAQGDALFLKEKKKDTIIIDKITIDNEKISSSLIRELLNKGEIKKVNEILGHPYELFGKVQKGSQIGSTLGFPTANIDLYDDYMNIKSGVYKTFVNICGDDKTYIGICNIGHNPTLNYVKKKRLEVHLIDYDGILYDKDITIKLIDYLREEIKFNSKEELINQLKIDRKRALL